METMSMGGFDPLHLLGALMLAGICTIIVYSLWNCCEKSESPPNTLREEKVQVKQLYALELEPGLVVLQSQDGAYFRILQECDSTAHRSGTSGSARGGLHGEPDTYLPSCVRTEVRNVASAPPSSGENLLSWDTLPPPYEG